MSVENQLPFILSVLGFHGKVLIVGSYGCRICEKLLEASSMSAETEQMSADPKMDLLLDKAKPISNSGSISVIMYSKKEKNPTH